MPLRWPRFVEEDDDTLTTNEAENITVDEAAFNERTATADHERLIREAVRNARYRQTAVDHEVLITRDSELYSNGHFEEIIRRPTDENPPRDEPTSNAESSPQEISNNKIIFTDTQKSLIKKASSLLSRDLLRFNVVKPRGNKQIEIEDITLYQPDFKTLGEQTDVTVFYDCNKIVFSQ